MEEVKENNIQKTMTVNSLTKKTNAEAKKLLKEVEKIAAEIKQIERETELENDLKIKKQISDQKTDTAFQMMILSHVMAATIGNGESFSTPRLFSENDLIEYKAKMLELLKRL
jgi:hypothetical protein